MATLTKDKRTAIKRNKQLDIFLLLIIFSEAILKFILILKQRISWDEFYFLSKVYSFQRGDLIEPYQNFHVHFLGWLSQVSANEITQIIAARSALFLLFLASGVLLYLISRHFINSTGALFVVLCWLSYSNIIEHGASLRYDSFCSFFFIFACFALLKENRPALWAILAGFAMGISLLFSIKAAIHVVSLAAMLGIMTVVLPGKKRVFKKALLFCLLLASTFGLGFQLHKSSLPPAPPQNFIQHASSKVIILNDLFPNGGYFSDTIRFNPVIWWLLGMGVFYAILEYKRKRNKDNLIALAFLVPLLSLAFYRNAFPYYYVFVMAPALVFCGILPHRLLHNFRETGSRTILLGFYVICFSIIGGAGFHFAKAFSQNNKNQKLLFDVVHKMFPTPVPYVDGCSAVASYPKVGFFMSHWGFEDYLAKGKPVFRRLFLENRPQFLLADTPHLDFEIPRQHPFYTTNYDFLPEDRELLENNFIPYWGMISVPGKVLYFKQTGERHEFEILIPGAYVIEESGPVMLDKNRIHAGEKVLLKIGKHSVQSLNNCEKVILRWADIPFTPSAPPPDMPTFYGF